SHAPLESRVRGGGGVTGRDMNDAASATAGLMGVGDHGVPTDFVLGRVSPQPTRGPARITFGLPRAASVRLTVNDVQGRIVATLAEGAWEAGVHEVQWSGRAGAPGRYFVRYTVP